MELIRRVYTAWVGNAQVVLVTSGMVFVIGIVAFGLRSGFVVTGEIGDLRVWGGLAFGLFMAALIVLVYSGWQFDGQPGRALTIAVSAAIGGGLIRMLFHRALSGGWLPIWGGLLVVAFALASYAAWKVQARSAVITIALLAYGMLVTAVLFAGLGRPVSAPIVLGLVSMSGYTLLLICSTLDRLRENTRTTRRELSAQIVTQSFLQSLRPALLWAIVLILIAVPPIIIGTGPIRSLGVLLLIGTLVSTYTALVLPVPLLLAWTGQSETDSPRSQVSGPRSRARNQQR